MAMADSYTECNSLIGIIMNEHNSKGIRLHLLLLATGLALAGCGRAPAPAPATPAPKSSTGGLPTLNSSPDAPPPPAVPAPAAIGAPPPPNVPAAASPTGRAGAAPANGLVQAIDAEGNSMTAEKIMNRALEIYVEGMGKPVPKDFNELVQAKVLQSIPPAPTGQKWVFDPKQGKIIASSQ